MSPLTLVLVKKSPPGILFGAAVSPNDIKSPRLLFRGSALELDKTTEALGLNPEVKLGKGQEPVQTLHWRMMGVRKGGKEGLAFSLPSDRVPSTSLGTSTSMGSGWKGH